MVEILSVILLACFFGLGFVLGKMKGTNDIIDEVMKEIDEEEENALCN